MSQERARPVTLKLCVVFVPEDRRFYERLEKVLKQLKRHLPLELCDTESILAGSEYTRERLARIAEADLLIYLLSADLLASEYYSQEQLQQLVTRHSRGEVQIFSVLLRALLLELLEPPFSRLALLPEDRKPVAERRHKESVFVDVGQKVIDFIKGMLEPRAPQSADSVMGGPFWRVPYERNRSFSGRVELLNVLRERLRAQRIAAVTGLGGIGKTQLALEYAYRHRQAYQAVFWLPADSRANLAAAGLDLARHLQLPERDSPEQALILSALKRWFRVHEDWLLILDNVNDLALLREFVPGEHHGHVLITTRVQAIGSIAYALPLPAWTDEEGANWLLWRARIHEPGAEQRRLALTITRLLEGLPLALDQAGAYLEETGASLEDYLQVYEQHSADVLQYRGHAPTDHTASVDATFALALAEVEALYTPASELLRLCAFLHPASIPLRLLIDEQAPEKQEFLPGLSSRYDLDVALGVLLRYSLVRRSPGANVFSLHRLVQTVQRDALSEAERRAWAERALALVSRAWPERGAAFWEIGQEYIPHALLCIAWIEQWQMRSSAAVRLLQEVGFYLAERAVYTEAERYLQQAQKLAATLTEEPALVTASLAHDLGWLAYRLGRYTLAEAEYRRALTLREALLGQEHLQTAQTLTALGLLYVEQRAGAEAEPLLLRALATREQQLGPFHPLVAETLTALGRLARLRKEYIQAEEYYRRALTIREESLGSASLEVAENLSNLGVLFFTQGAYKEAEPFYRRALAIRESLLGPEHPETAAAVSRLALALYFQRRYDEAQPLIQRALGLQEQTWGREHPETAQTMMTLAMLLYRQGNYPQAETLAEEVLTIRERILHPHAPDIITTLNNLALIYREQEKYEQARVLLRRALPLSEQEHGREHANTVRIRDNLAVLAQRAGWPAEDDTAPA